ncbi:MAG: ferredoxin [Candidatus Firestonebacteria bacterium]
MANKTEKEITRRELLSNGIRNLSLVLLGLGIGAIAVKGNKKQHLWQINPKKCTQCGRCATECILSPSAVKCAHEYSICGYCKLCFGYFAPGQVKLDTGAENQLCPTGALGRKFVEDPYYEYSIKDKLCIGCGKCVKGCNTFGNGSLYLQIKHDKCVNCNECSIAKACPSDAIVRVPADTPYIPNVKG